MFNTQLLYSNAVEAVVGSTSVRQESWQHFSLLAVTIIPSFAIVQIVVQFGILNYCAPSCPGETLLFFSNLSLFTIEIFSFLLSV